MERVAENCAFCPARENARSRVARAGKAARRRDGREREVRFAKMTRRGRRERAIRGSGRAAEEILLECLRRSGGGETTTTRRASAIGENGRAPRAIGD